MTTFHGYEILYWEKHEQGVYRWASARVGYYIDYYPEHGVKIYSTCCSDFTTDPAYIRARTCQHCGLKLHPDAPELEMPWTVTVPPLPSAEEVDSPEALKVCRHEGGGKYNIIEGWRILPQPAFTFRHEPTYPADIQAMIDKQQARYGARRESDIVRGIDAKGAMK